jgi:hypothetical protein
MNGVFGARDKTGRARLGVWGRFQMVSRVPFMFAPVPLNLVLPQTQPIYVAPQPSLQL